MRLVWLKRRFRCPESSCPMGSWTEDDPRIASKRLMMTDRAGRWITEQVGRCARSVSEVARELGCDWHTVNDAVIAYGSALVDHPDRFGTVEALGLDEVLMVKRGPLRRQEFSTQLVDVGRGQLLDVVPGRSSTGPMVWLAKKGKAWCDQVRFATLDLSGPYRKVFTLMTPEAVQVADPFHLVMQADTKLDECRRRVQNETLGHRGRKSDPLYRCRRLLTKGEGPTGRQGPREADRVAPRRRPERGCRHHLAGQGGRPRALRPRRSRPRSPVGDELGRDLQDNDYPIEARSLGRTLRSWKHEIAAWHRAHVSNGPTEAVNNLIKRVKRAAFGFTHSATPVVLCSSRQA